jgi:hypothetical protein
MMEALMRTLVFFAAALFLAATHASAADLSDVIIVQRFVADGDPGQCGGAGEKIVSAAEDWSPAIRIDADDRSGGCNHSIGIVDIAGELNGLQIIVDYFGDGEAGQCGGSGHRIIPIGRKLKNAVMTDPPLRYDTDSRSGGCQQKYTVSGRNDVGLEIDFRGDDDVTQCQNPGTYKAFVGQPVQFRIDTDQRFGGCTLKYRLFKR